MITNKKQNVPNPLFGKQNFTLMIIGAIIMAIGFFVMAGGKSADPNKFNDAEIYSFTRITLAHANYCRFYY